MLKKKFDSPAAINDKYSNEYQEKDNDHCQNDDNDKYEIRLLRNNATC